MGVLIRRRLLAVFASGLVSSTALGSQAPSKQPAEYEVKAAFLLNFARYIRWPDEAFPDPAAPFTICVAELNPFGTALERMVMGETVADRRVVIRAVTSPPTAAECHLLFVPRALDRQIDVWLATTQKRPVVTVGESPRFVPSGGIINLVNKDGRIRFEVNGAAARRNGLDVSSRLLALAVTAGPE